MTRILALLLMAVVLPSSFAADVYWSIADFTAASQRTNRIYITPLSFPAVSGSNIISKDRQTFTNDSNGLLIVSNLVTPGSYRIEIVGAYTTTTFTNTFPIATNGFLNGADFISSSLAVGGTVAYSQTASDARYVAKSSGTVTNLVATGQWLKTNALSAWPTAASSYGDAYIGNSNGVIYILTSTPSALTWAATNKIAP